MLPRVIVEVLTPHPSWECILFCPWHAPSTKKSGARSSGQGGLAPCQHFKAVADNKQSTDNWRQRQSNDNCQQLQFRKLPTIVLRVCSLTSGMRRAVLPRRPTPSACGDCRWAVTTGQGSQGKRRRWQFGTRSRVTLPAAGRQSEIGACRKRSAP